MLRKAWLKQTDRRHRFHKKALKSSRFVRQIILNNYLFIFFFFKKAMTFCASNDSNKKKKIPRGGEGGELIPICLLAENDLKISIRGRESVRFFILNFPFRF